jgi:hypothetical protein
LRRRFVILKLPERSERDARRPALSAAEGTLKDLQLQRLWQVPRS